MPAVSIGQTIASYRITRQIGAGGMGAVFEATHIVLAYRAALKILTSDYHAQPNLVQRFRNEAMAASQINHPGIVKVMELGTLEDGRPWLAMEFIEGDSLAQRLRAGLRFQNRCLGTEYFWIICDLASALTAAHATGIIHRDLKPANVMVVSDPSTLSGERAKVLDFGIAKLLHSHDITKPGSILGTPLYMALEQFKDSGEVDGRADVFSLGVIAFEILTGRRPHNGQTHYEVMGSRLMEPIPPIQQLAPSVSSEMAALVTRMLAREPENRPTMAEVEIEARRLLGLPAPRQSGWHSAVAVTDQSQPEIPQASPLQINSSASTPDARPGTLDLSSLPPTPSSERASGEISPSPSLSSMPSVAEVGRPRLVAGPEDRTAQPAPTPYIPEAMASPSAPTVRERSPARSGFLFGAIAAISILVGTPLALWIRRQPSPGPAQPPPVQSTLVQAAPPPEVARPQVAAPPVEVHKEPETPPELPVAAKIVAPTVTTPEPVPRRVAEAKSSTSARAASRCSSVAITESCIKGRNVAQELKRNVLSALGEKPIRLCAGDRLVISIGPEGVRWVEAPSRLSDTARQDFLLTLRGYLDVNPRSSRIEIECANR